MPDHAILLEDNESEPGSPHSTASTMMTAPSHADLTDDEAASISHDPEAPPPPYSAIPPALPPRVSKADRDESKALPVEPSSSMGPSTLPPDPQPTQAQVLQGHTLSPANKDDGGKRKLLLVFIHGFMGDETSFQSFPIHVHDLVSVLLYDSHAVYTKVYPRYRSKGRIDATARDFSNWLKPHESPNTDVVLIGHSMGGILTAEVALLPAESSDSPSVLRHRIIGTISLDAPLLGMHPGIITSGISSLFRRDTVPVAAAAVAAAAASTELSPQTSASSTSAASTSRSSLADSLIGSSFEKNFNQPFYNDIRLPVREGWKNAWHFISKHSENITAATQQLLYSHAEFGACLADFEELKVRYCRIRMLEEPDEQSRQNALNSDRPPPRVRFTNYYTASTGRRQPAIVAADTSSAPANAEPSIDGRGSVTEKAESIATSSLYSRITLEELEPRALEHEPEPEPEQGLASKSKSEPEPSDTSSESDSSGSSSDSHSVLTPVSDSPFETAEPAVPAELAETTPALPTRTSPPVPSPLRVPVPPLPVLPQFSSYSDRSAYKQALQSYKQAVKAHHQALAANLKLDAERRKQELKFARLQLKSSATNSTDKTAAKAAAKLDKAASKRDKHAAKAAARRARGLAKSAAKDERRSIKSAAKDERRAAKAAERAPSAAVASLQAHLDASSSSSARAAAAPEKERRFCILPPADAAGARDPCWVRVRMDGVDEVGAHCGLFFPRDPGDEAPGGAAGGEGWSERYAWLVGDVAERIEGWALAAADERLSRVLAGGD